MCVGAAALQEQSFIYMMYKIHHIISVEFVLWEEERYAFQYVTITIASNSPLGLQSVGLLLQVGINTALCGS